MKKFLLFAALAAALAFFATSCYQPVVTPLGDDLANFTKKADKTTELVGVKNMANGVVLVEPVYDAVVYKMDYIIAAKDDSYAVFERTGERVFGDLNINKVKYGKTYFVFTASQDNEKNGKYFFLPHQELCGPADEFLYYPDLFLLFYKDGQGHWGEFDPETGEVCVEPEDSDLVLAIDEKGNRAFYRGSKTLVRLYDGNRKAVTKANFNAMVKEAEQNKTPWPKTGVGVVKVKKLR